MKLYIWSSVILVTFTLAAFLWNAFGGFPTAVDPNTEATISVDASTTSTVPAIPEPTTPPGTGGPMLTPTPSDEMPTGQQKVRMGVGKTASAFGLSVTFNNIVSDSRCPVDAQCIWAGMFVADVTLASGAKSETIQIEQNDIREWNGYSVTLASVEPIPKSTEEKKPEDYFLTFVVMK